MLKKGLISEFQHETENTRKLLKSIPDSALEWKPQEKNWSIAELAAHIVEIYSWYDAVYHANELDFSKVQYDKGDLTSTKSIVAKFEENVILAEKALENFDESTMFDLWKMTYGNKELIPPTPKVGMIRGLLCSHLYHHRGELVAYLRASGNKVPGLYGPTADDMF